MILIADSGSTKTAWCFVEDPEHIIYTQGINPFQQSEEEICAILQHELLPNFQLSTSTELVAPLRKRLLWPVLYVRS